MKPIPIDKGWTLFLDRDGVLNRKIENGYVRTPDELDILSGIPEALARFSAQFTRIVVVTNQRGIGRGLMTESDFDNVTEHLLQVIRVAGGRIDAVYHCPHLVEDACDCRKPGSGMPMQAKAAFPEIDFSRSVMIGDSNSDMVMGRRLGMLCIGVGPDVKGFQAQPDYSFSDITEIRFGGR
jgi:D-glycero-D-manno-heptose 1,7-bisphosphate phosphatase